MSVRLATFEDYPGIGAVLRRNGLTLRDFEAWKRIWTGNPYAEELADIPMGWVIENEKGEIVGTHTNIASLSMWRGKKLRTAIASAWAVDPDYRRQSLGLLVPYLRQSNVDLLVNTSANPEAGKVLRGMKSSPIPHRKYVNNLVWVTNHSGFAAAMLGQRGIPAAKILGLPAGAALKVVDVFRGGIRRQPKGIISIDAFDERFDFFWDQLKNRSTRVLSFRDSGSLRWRFQPMLDSGRLVIKGLLGKDGLQGYIILRRRDRPKLGLTRLQVSDLQVLDDSAENLRTLVLGGLVEARNQGIDVVDLVGFHASKQDALAPLAPRYRDLPNMPYFFKATDSSLHQELQNPDAWDPSPFDGDDSV